MQKPFYRWFSKTCQVDLIKKLKERLEIPSEFVKVFVNFSARFIPNLATTAEALRKLTRKNVPFKWGQEQQLIWSIKTKSRKIWDIGIFW